MFFRTGATGHSPAGVSAAEMPARMDDVMRLCCEISAHEQIKVAVKNSTKGAMVAGGTAFVGGLLGGPPGIAVGKENRKKTLNLLYECRTGT